MRRARRMISSPAFELGLRDDGTFSLFYRGSCRFVSEPTSDGHGGSLCTLFGKPARPQICVDYSANRCWYRPSFGAWGGLDGREDSTSFLRLTPQRLAALEAMTGFDDSGEIARVPAWEELLAVLRDPRSFPLYERRPLPGLVHRFAMGTPRRRRHFDLIRFRLGFPGVFVDGRSREWELLIRPGPESSSTRLGSPGLSRGQAVFGLEDLDRVTAASRFDEAGRVRYAPFGWDLARILERPSGGRAA